MLASFTSRPISSLAVLAAVWICLAGSAFLNQAYNAWIGLGTNDSENLETTRIHAAARQFETGPGFLYGPFSRKNPFVLIQAPLYFRATWLLGLPMVRLGLGPVPAALAAGRLISYAGFLACLWVVALLARRDGANWRAGVWALLLTAASPVIASYPVTMRPDMLGVLFQTFAMMALLKSLDRKPHSMAWLMLGFAAFGLAICVKQHLVAGLGLAMLLLAWSVWKHKIAFWKPLAAVAVAAAVVAIDLGVEQWLTHGMLSRSIFEIPSSLRAVSGGSWSYVGTVFLETIKRSMGLIGVGMSLLFVLRGRGLRRTDSIMLAWMAVELVEMVGLCLNSSGAWYNYAMQAVVCGSIVIGRGLAGIDWEWVKSRRLIPLAIASILLLATTARMTLNWTLTRLDEQKSLRALLEDPSVLERGRDERFFAQLPQYNRMYGRADLVYDDWLYSSFEAMGAAEPLVNWLEPELATGRVRLVVTPDRVGDRVPGLAETLPELGYVATARFGLYYVWQRSDTPRFNRTEPIGNRGGTRDAQVIRSGHPSVGGDSGPVGRSAGAHSQ